jgi:mannosyltransferase
VTASQAATLRRPARPSTSRPPFAVGDRVIVAALALLAVALRALYLGRAYWIDEGISIGIASHRVSQLPSLLRRDGSPPLFYLILHFWMRAFGTSEVATHLLPLLFSVAAIPVAYWAGTELFDRRAGLAGAALMATNPFLNWYASETRMYTLVVLLATAGVTFAWRAARDRRLRDWAAAVAVYATLLYTHDWAIYLAAATGLVLLSAAWSGNDRTLAAWTLAGGALTLVLWAPWVPSFLYQAANTAAPWAVRPQIGDFFADPASALGGTLGFLIAPLLGIGAWLCRGGVAAEDGRVARLVGSVALLTSVLGFVGAQLEPSWTVRYLAVIVAPYLLAAAGALAPTARGRTIVVAACGLLTAWSLVGALLPNPNGRYAKDNMAAVARAVAPLLHPGDAVIVTQTEQLAVARHYLPGYLQYLTPTGPTTDPTVVDWRRIVPRLFAATPCSALSPTLDALPVGADVLEIDPVRQLGASGTAWSRAANYQVMAVDQFLAGDPALKLVGLYTPGLRPRPYAPVDGVLFQKTAPTRSCA